MRSMWLVVAKGLVMTVVLAGMLLLQVGVRFIYGFGELEGHEVPADEAATFGEINAWVCALAGFVAVALALSSFGQHIWSKQMEQVPGDRRPSGSTAPRASGWNLLEAVVYITVVMLLAAWGVWTTHWYRRG